MLALRRLGPVAAFATVAAASALLGQKKALSTAAITSASASTQGTAVCAAPASAPTPLPVEESRALSAASAKIASVSSGRSLPLNGNIRRDVEALVLRLQDEICDALSKVEVEAGSTAEGLGIADLPEETRDVRQLVLEALPGTPVPTGAESSVGPQDLMRQRRGMFIEDTYKRTRGGVGGGRTRVLQGGAVFEKAGVAVTVTEGPASGRMVDHMRARPSRGAFLTGPGPFRFFAAGISLVLHPHNPHAPTTHANYRYFEITGARDPATGRPVTLWWFGGGADLTPSVLYEEDAVFFHSGQKAACDAHDSEFYPAFKRWADAYFANPVTRDNERRGIGGIFYDDFDDGSTELGEDGDGHARAGLGAGSIADAIAEDAKMARHGGGGLPDILAQLRTQQEASKGSSSSSDSSSHSASGTSGSSSDDVSSAAAAATTEKPLRGPYAAFPFVVSAGESFLPSYLPLVLKRKDTPFTDEDKRVQQLRRGRYVEFNLVVDRGTKFGFAASEPRIESILMSLPLTARFEYAHVAPPGSAEARLMEVVRRPVDWVPLA